MKPQEKKYNAAEYRAKIEKLLANADGYLLAVVYGFVKTLTGGAAE